MIGIDARSAVLAGWTCAPVQARTADGHPMVALVVSPPPGELGEPYAELLVAGAPAYGYPGQRVVAVPGSVVSALLDSCPHTKAVDVPALARTLSRAHARARSEKS